MLINLQSIEKSLGQKLLYDGLDVALQPGEKVGLIGRNGIGKTTLLKIMDGTDTEFGGSIERRRGLIIATTAQEHHGLGDISVLSYLLGGLPEYRGLKQVIDSLPESMGDDIEKISQYTDALSRFGELGYFDIEERAKRELAVFQIPTEVWNGPFAPLSGGQKRLVELVKVTLTQCDLALIDEPTNHMDFAAKAVFIEWLQAAASAVVVITHDRDVLGVVDRIIELKSHGAVSFAGNYDRYLAQNGDETARAIDTYENGQKRLVKLQKQIREAKAKKAGWSGTADKTNPFMLLERRLTKEADELRLSLTKPDFWIDQETVEGLRDKVVAKYDKYRSQNIQVDTSVVHRHRSLLEVHHLSLGYGDAPLFQPVSFEVAVGDRVELHGRNGVGKSTLVRMVQAMSAQAASASRIVSGTISLSPKLVIGTYEQEVDEDVLDQPLETAIAQVYESHGLPCTPQMLKRIMAQYLFEPMVDGRLPLRSLSGGQKARFQLIAMLAHHPNLLILDEPTNHLDLPSIEELEKALTTYSGAIVFISHDSIFTRNLAADRIEIVPVS